MRILVVDDDFLGREILLTFLEEYGMCDSACNGGEALEKFHQARTTGTPYDLICLDVQMPVLDGNQVLAEIRKTETDGGHKSCVFIITAHESPELIEHIAGANDFISKPCSANLIKRLFERHHLLQSTVTGTHNVLVVSVDANIRAAIAHALTHDTISLVECASFVEAEHAALANPFSAVAADIPTIVKSRNEERLAVFSLQNIYPFIRVKVTGDLVLPIIASQEEYGQSAISYLEKSYSTFAQRRLRAYKRHKSLVPVLISNHDCQQHHTFTLDISWGGAFIVMNSVLNLTVGSCVSVHLPTLNISIMADIIRIQAWGKQGVAPGLGLSWKSPLEITTTEGLQKVLRAPITSDRDRLLG